MTSMVRALTAVLRAQLLVQELGGRTSARLTARLLAWELRDHAPPERVPEPAPPPSAWDPDEHELERELEELKRDTYDCSRVKALLLEVLRRAMYDWVLYRTSGKHERRHAFTAHVWLFEEQEGHPDRLERKTPEARLMSFESICDILDLEPEVVRRRVRAMTIRDILIGGRPAEHRRRRGDHEGIQDIEEAAGPSGFDDPSPPGNMYEQHFNYGTVRAWP